MGLGEGTAGARRLIWLHNKVKNAQGVMKWLGMIRMRGSVVVQVESSWVWNLLMSPRVKKVALLSATVLCTVERLTSSLSQIVNPVKDSDRW